MVRILSGVVVQSALFAVLILGPAFVLEGNLAWPRGMLVVAILAVVSAAGAFWFQKVDPELARERASAPRAQSPADAIAMLVIAVTSWPGSLS